MEIERKWLINPNNIPYNLLNAKKTSIEQTYINFEPEIRVRKINNGEKYILTVKSNLTDSGLKRDEYEIEITKEEYENLVIKKEGTTILKDRYTLTDTGNIIELDIFKENLLGLSYMEIEFNSEETANGFTTPDWVIKDVTNDIRYKNGHLARYGMPK